VVHIGAKLKEYFDMSFPMPSASVEWRVAVTVAGTEIRAVLYQPSGQCIWTLMERQCGLFEHASTCIDVIGIEQGLKPFQTAVL
jgi:hypothetical protein